MVPVLSKGYVNTQTRPTQPFSLPLRLSAHSYLCADTGEGVGKVIELLSPVGRRGSFCSPQVYNNKYTVVKRESVSSNEYSEVLHLIIGPS
jgi:hypothetical protein